MPTTINTILQLQAMENDLTEDYELGSNIDASITPTWNGGLGFDQIGKSGTPFTGSFDGKGFTITDLFIARPEETFVGLFGFTGNGAGFIKNVGIVTCDITGESVVGALVGQIDNNGGAVTDCYSTGSVTATSNDSNVVEVGGLIGYAAPSELTDCYSTCSVTATSTHVSKDISEVGGLVGIYNRLTAITRCYATGNVVCNSALDAHEIGGLIGYDAGATITECYATGDISVTATEDVDSVGGFVGDAGSNDPTSDCYARGDVTVVAGVAANSGDIGGFVGVVGDVDQIIDDCYSTGLLTVTGGVPDVGGFCGDNFGTITNCFWDTQTSGTGTSDGGTGKTTAQMKTKATFTDAGWDFVSVWGIVSGTNNGYPILTAVLGELVVTTETCESVVGATATGRGTLVSLGNSDPTAHGHCWDTSVDPDTGDSLVDNGAAAATGTFISAITGLTPGTAYYTRAFATNTEGTSYGANVYFVAPKTGTTGRAGYTWDEDSNLRSFDENAIERRYIHTDDVDDVSVDGAIIDPISSNWAFDHENALFPHPLHPIVCVGDEVVCNNNEVVYN